MRQEFSRRQILIRRALKRQERELARLRRRMRKRKVKQRAPIIPKSKQIRRINYRTSASLRIPTHFSITENYDATMAFFNEIRNQVIDVKAGLLRIFIDQVELITPETSLVLIAELYRLSEYSPKMKLHLYGECKSKEANDLLEGVGFNDYFSTSFDRPKTRRSQIHKSRTYIRHRKGFRTNNRTAADLVEQFSKKIHLSKLRQERLRISLGECMENVGEHAYLEIDKKPRKWLKGIWWLLAYTDEREVYFAFLDQGIGIPRTIREGIKRRKITDPELFDLSDGEIVTKAFHQPLSRTGESHRGRGLPTLRQYAASAASGYLSVYTDTTCCLFPAGGSFETKTTGTPMKGTLLVWHIKDVLHGSNESNS